MASPYRLSCPPQACDHVWDTKVIHYNYGDPSVITRCRKCRTQNTGLSALWAQTWALRLPQFFLVRFIQALIAVGIAAIVVGALLGLLILVFAC